MSGVIRTFLRRATGNVFVLSKNYHSQPHVGNSCCGLVGVLKNEQNIYRFIQKTLIPLNTVKPKPAILDIPCTNVVGRIDLNLPEKVDEEPSKQIIDPGRIYEKKAYRMLIIKRKQMNKHKLEKRRRKLKHYYATIRRNRRMRKEVAFRQEIVTKLKEAEKFNVEAYVAEKLEIYRRNILPARLHGKIMPASIIADRIEKKKFKLKCIDKIKARRLRFIAERGTLDVDTKH